MYESQTDDNASWTRMNPYIRIANLPSYIEGSSPMVIITSIDTSGSVSDDDLKVFLGIV